MVCCQLANPGLAKGAPKKSLPGTPPAAKKQPPLPGATPTDAVGGADVRKHFQPSNRPALTPWISRARNALLVALLKSPVEHQ